MIGSGLFSLSIKTEFLTYNLRDLRILNRRLNILLDKISQLKKHTQTLLKTITKNSDKLNKVMTNSGKELQKMYMDIIGPVNVTKELIMELSKRSDAKSAKILFARQGEIGDNTVFHAYISDIPIDTPIIFFRRFAMDFFSNPINTPLTTYEFKSGGKRVKKKHNT